MKVAAVVISFQLDGSAGDDYKDATTAAEIALKNMSFIKFEHTLITRVQRSPDIEFAWEVSILLPLPKED